MEDGIMKEALNKMFGKEWQWFCRQELRMKLCLLWFVFSFMLLGIDTENVWCVMALVLNFCISGMSLRSLSDDGIEE